MDWTSVAIFHHAHQELLLGLFQRATNSTNLEKASTASLTANNQHTKIQIVFQGLRPSQFLTSFQTLTVYEVYDLHSSGISKEPLLLASNRGLASPSAQMDEPGRKDGELKYAWGGVECFFFWILRLVLIFHELLGLMAVKHGRSSPTWNVRVDGWKRFWTPLSFQGWRAKEEQSHREAVKTKYCQLSFITPNPNHFGILNSSPFHKSRFDNSFHLKKQNHPL